MSDKYSEPVPPYSVFDDARAVGVPDEVYRGASYTDLAGSLNEMDEAIATGGVFPLSSLPDPIVGKTIQLPGGSTTTAALGWATTGEANSGLYRIGTHDYGWIVNGTLVTEWSAAAFKISYLTTGSVLFSGASGLITQNNSNFYWDDAARVLSLGAVTVNADFHFRIAGTATATGTSGASMLVNDTIPATGTSRYAGLQVSQVTATAAFTLADLMGIYIASTTVGAGSAVTRASGVVVRSTGIQASATSSVGFYYGAVTPSFTGHWGYYNDGATSNYMGTGSTGFNTITPRRKVDILDASSAQLRLTFTDNSVYTDFLTTSGGVLQVSPTGKQTQFIDTNVGSFVLLDVTNSDNTNAASNARLRALVGGASAGDPFVHLSIISVQDWVVGIDNSDSDSFKISTGSAIGTSDRLVILTGGNVGVGTGTARRKLDVMDNGGTPQARLTYTDNSVYTDLQTTSSGQFSIIPTVKQINFGGAPGTGYGVSCDATALPTGTGTAFYLAGNYASPVTGRLFIGDGTGWQFHFSKRSASVSTDLFTLLDSGNFGVNTATPRRKVDILDTAAAQLRVTHTDNSVYVEFRAISTGDLTITTTNATNPSVAHSRALASQKVTIETVNNDNTSVTSHAQINASVGGASAGDPYYCYTISGVINFVHGLDNSNLDAWTLNDSSAVVSTANARITIYPTSEFVVNENQQDYDFRIEGDSASHMFFVDATSTTENIALLATAAPNWQTMDKGVFIGNADAAPTGNPASGGFLYVNAGALTYRGSGGTVTILGPA